MSTPDYDDVRIYINHSNAKSGIPIVNVQLPSANRMEEFLAEALMKCGGKAKVDLVGHTLRIVPYKHGMVLYSKYTRKLDGYKYRLNLPQEIRDLLFKKYGYREHDNHIKCEFTKEGTALLVDFETTERGRVSEERDGLPVVTLEAEVPVLDLVSPPPFESAHAEFIAAGAKLDPETANLVSQLSIDFLMNAAILPATDGQ